MSAFLSPQASANERPIYLDYQASTPMDPRVLEVMLPYFQGAFGNASSAAHAYGHEAAQAIKQAAQQVADLVDGNLRPGVSHPLIWTSGATESINLALQGYVRQHQPTLDGQRPFRLATLALEHKAVLDTAKLLEREGLVELVLLDVNAQGQLDLVHLEQELKQGLDLLAIMAANNEIGTIYPVQTIAKLARDHDCAFFCDGSQAVGKIPLEFENWGITLLALTGHKMYGPKGCGALIVRRGTRLKAQIYGGGHQHGLRSGTLNVPGIVGLGEACALRAAEMQADETHTAMLRDRLQALLQAQIPDLQVNGDLEQRLAGNLHLSLLSVPNDLLVSFIQCQIALSTGSACTSGLEASSHVLTAIGLAPEALRGALRLSLGKFTTETEIETAAEALIQAYTQAREQLN